MLNDWPDQLPERQPQGRAHLGPAIEFGFLALVSLIAIGGLLAQAFVRLVSFVRWLFA